MAENQSEFREDEVWNAIQACEQILEAMPNDRHALRTVSSAYEQVGDMARAHEFTLHLADVLISESDTDAAAEIRPRIEAFADDPVAAEILARLDALAAEATPPAAEPAPPADTGSVAFDLTTEIALAWALRETDGLSEDEYAAVVDDLTRLTSGDSSANILTISVLHVLQDRGNPNLEKIMNVIAKRFETPVVRVSSFVIVHEIAALLPVQYIVTRGALPFERLGEHILVAVLNPQDEGMRKDVQQRLGAKCFFYLAHPTDFDAGVESVRNVLSSDDS